MIDNRMMKLAQAVLLIILVSGCEKGGAPPVAEPQKILEITAVQLAILKSDPPQLNINAKGNTSSSGWTNPELKPFVYVAPPQDGIYDFDFVATPPAEGSATVITPIEVTHTLSPLPGELKGVRIHATQNKMEAMLPAGDS
jgi:hypothetical protein